MTLSLELVTVAELVRKDYRTADVFKKWGINFCCGGNLSLEATCQLKGYDKAAIEQELIQATKEVRIPAAIDFDQWPIEFLIDYLLHVHHAFMRKMVPNIQATLVAFVPGHKKKYPYIEKVQEIFDDLASELMVHMQKEEDIVFPYIRQMSSTLKNKEVYGPLFVRMLKKSLQEIAIKDHNCITALLIQLRKETSHYSFAENACTRLQVIYNQLKDFDADLVQHKHLENNILFPKAETLEKELLQL